MIVNWILRGDLKLEPTCKLLQEDVRLVLLSGFYGLD